MTKYLCRYCEMRNNVAFLLLDVFLQTIVLHIKLKQRKIITKLANNQP